MKSTDMAPGGSKGPSPLDPHGSQQFAAQPGLMRPPRPGINAPNPPGDGKMRPSRQRSEERAAAYPQVKLVLSLETRNYLRAVSARMDIPERQVIDRMVIETKELQRKVEALGFSTIGEALAVLRVLREKS